MGNFDKDTYVQPRTVIKVIGVGGAGCNAVSNLMECNEIKEVEFIMVGREWSFQEHHNAPCKIMLNKKGLSGL